MGKEMTNARTYFAHVLEAVDQVEVFHERALRYMEMADSVPGFSSGMPHGTDAYSRTENYAIVLADLANDMTQRVLRLMIIIDEAAGVIAQIQSRKQRCLMRWVYFCGCSLQEAAARMCYTGSLRALQRMHERAMEEAEKIMEKMEKAVVCRSDL